jgi:hypothetical protein
MASSEASTLFTWFEGYAWQVASCAGCGTHLGWRFVSVCSASHALLRAIPGTHPSGLLRSESSPPGYDFFGLIVTRLSEDDSPN